MTESLFHENDYTMPNAKHFENIRPLCHFRWFQSRIALEAGIHMDPFHAALLRHFFLPLPCSRGRRFCVLPAKIIQFLLRLSFL